MQQAEDCLQKIHKQNEFVSVYLNHATNIHFFNNTNCEFIMFMFLSYHVF